MSATHLSQHVKAWRFQKYRKMQLVDTVCNSSHFDISHVYERAPLIMAFLRAVDKPIGSVAVSKRDISTAVGLITRLNHQL